MLHCLLNLNLVLLLFFKTGVDFQTLPKFEELCTFDLFNTKSR